MADKLRAHYEYAETHRVHNHHVMIEAADHIERLEQQIADMDQWCRDNVPDPQRRRLRPPPHRHPLTWT